jgi:hypothetical protein
MAAYLAAVLTIIEAREHFPETEDLDRLTVPEAVHLAAALFLTVQHNATHLSVWGRWRRRKNKQAERSHYRHRGHREPGAVRSRLQPQGLEAVAFYRALGDVRTETRPEWHWTLVHFEKRLDSSNVG